MRPIMRTTVILDEELRKKLKMLSVQKDISMKEIITQSLEEKIKRELEGTDTRDEFEDNKIISSINNKLESVFGPAATRVLLVQICKKFDVSPRRLTQSDVTTEFVEAICEKALSISSPDEVFRLKKELLMFVKKR